nr:isoform 3 of probable purine permease 11 [Quercus suber]
MLPYLSATDFNASKASLNSTEPFKLSQARKRRSSSKSLHIVWLLSNVPLSTKIAIEATLAAAVLLGRFYYDQGGNSKWMATLVQTAAFPILLIPFFLIPSSKEPSNSSAPPSFKILASIYFSLGVLIAGDNILVSKWQRVIGFLCTLGASALYSLLLSLKQLSFQKVIKKETFSVVLEMQIYTALVATCVSVVGLFASGEWKTLHGEMVAFSAGRVSYVMTLVWTAVAWQVCSVGVVGLIFVVSSLFSNVISTASLAITPVASVIVFRDKMNGIKVIALLLAIWGFVSYIYQNYLDDCKARRTQNNDSESQTGSLF